MNFVTFFATAAFILILISVLLLGIFAVISGYHRDEKGRFDTNKIVTGWTLLGISSMIAFVAILTMFFWDTGGSMLVIILILLAPIIVLASIIFLLTFGIITITSAVKKNEEGKREKKKLVPGILMIVAACLIVAAIIALFGYFAAHPIRFM